METPHHAQRPARTKRSKPSAKSLAEEAPLFPGRRFILISGDSSRLAPFAAGMAKRFLDLSRMDNADLPGHREQAALLATGIAALGPAEFASVQGQLADLAQKDGLRDDYPLLYLRLADAGPKLFAIYRDQFLAQSATQKEKLLAALAICRIGQADSELISAIKSEWSESDNDAAKADNYRAALFVALAKLGQEDLLRSSARIEVEGIAGVVRCSPGGSRQDGGWTQQLHAPGVAPQQHLRSPFYGSAPSMDARTMARR